MGFRRVPANKQGRSIHRFPKMGIARCRFRYHDCVYVLQTNRLVTKVVAGTGLAGPRLEFHDWLLMFIPG
jgi:hypothetical protein